MSAVKFDAKVRKNFKTVKQNIAYLILHYHFL
jgi:hypothetical protein